MCYIYVCVYAYLQLCAQVPSEPLRYAPLQLAAHRRQSVPHRGATDRHIIDTVSTRYIHADTVSTCICNACIIRT